MAGAPLLGSWLNSTFHWGLNFVVITILVFLSLIGTWLFIHESLTKEQRTSLNLICILKGYSKLLTSFDFIWYMFITLLLFIRIVIYTFSLSLIFINHLEISIKEFGFYQTSTIMIYFLFSALSAKIVPKKGLDYTRNLGGFIIIMRGTDLFLTSVHAHTLPILICLSMAIFAADGSLIVDIFRMKALESFPDMKGSASSMNTAIRQYMDLNRKHQCKDQDMFSHLFFCFANINHVICFDRPNQSCLKRT